MVLASQMQHRRGGGSYTSTFRQRRKRRVRRIGAALVIVGLLGWFGTTLFWGPADTDAANAPSDAVAASPLPTPSPMPLNSNASSPRVQRPAPYDPARNSAPQASANTPPIKPQPTPAVTPNNPPAIVSPGHTPAVPAVGNASPSAIHSAAPLTPAPAQPTPPPAQTPAPTVTPARPAGPGDPEVARLASAGRQLIAQNQLVKGRDLLNQALRRARGADAANLREELQTLNERMIFSREVIADDPYVETYVIQPGDALAKIAPRYNVPWEFIARINGNLDPNRIRVGARLKVVKGPFHARVYKNEFRMDMYLGDPDSNGLFVRSFRVGLGKDDATPVGGFVVKRHSKLENPEWVNPRTGDKFLADHPENPLGERWVGLRGTDPDTEALLGYGVHGTIEPHTIGTQASMGCVRLVDADIRLVYDMMTEEQSTVRTYRSEASQQ